MDLGQTLFDTRLDFAQASFGGGTLLYMSCAAIVGENYLLLEKEDLIVYEQDSSIFQVMPEIVVVLPRISAPRPAPRSDSAA